MTIRVGLFGNGFARHVMLPGLRHVAGIELVGIASPNRERVEATRDAFGIGAAFTDHRELLAKCDPDLVFVVTPPHRHLDQTLDALEAGCHVVCEKPTALNGEQSLAMLEAAEAHPSRLTIIDHELRFDPRRKQLLDWVAEERFGTLLHVDYCAQSSSLVDGKRPWSWWNDANQGGGILGALGSHAVDSLRSLMGEAKTVTGNVATYHKTRPDAVTGEPRVATADEYSWAHLEFESGAVAHMTLSVVAPERRHVWTVTGTRGIAVLEEQQPLRVGFDGAALEAVSIAEELPTNEELCIPDTDWARNFVRLARAVVSAIEAGRSVVDEASTFRDGHENQRVLDAVRESGGSRTIAL